MTPEQARAVLKSCRAVQKSCPWLKIIPETDPVEEIFGSVFGKN
jgi:hypothetical protein